MLRYEMQFGIRGAGNSLPLIIVFFSHTCFGLDLSTGSRFGKSPFSKGGFFKF
jgi:hypothetical protein